MRENLGISVMIGLAVLGLSAVSSGQTTLISEDFATGSGLTPPAGWVSTLVMGNNPSQDGWRWDNPGGIGINAPMADPTAICDSDNSGSNNFVVAQLDSPTFSASAAPSILLTWDQWHRPLSSLVEVTVFDGANHNVVFTDNSGTLNPDAQSLDITSAAGGATNAFVRFTYTANFDWWWLVDNVSVVVPAVTNGQAPKIGTAVFDCNAAANANGLPVSSAANGPFFTTATLGNTMDFHFAGMPNQPFGFFTGPLNPGNASFPSGQLDLGTNNMGTIGNVQLLASGISPGVVNSFFILRPDGMAELTTTIPSFMAGQMLAFQCFMFTGVGTGCFSNAVEISILSPAP